MMIHTDTIKATLLSEIQDVERAIDAAVNDKEYPTFLRGQLSGLRRAYKDLTGDWPPELPENA